MTIALEEVATPRQILLVEDEAIARESLARLLRGRGYEVVLADSGSNAILQAGQEDVGVVLMDIVLGAEMDGIEAAREIQDLVPFTSFIFTSAYASDPTYVARIASSGVRVGGMLDKPIQIENLPGRIEKELQKLRLLAWLGEVRDQGGDPLEHLTGLQDLLSPEIFASLEAELRSSDLAEEEILPFRGLQDEDALMHVAAEIDRLYTEIRNLVDQPTGDPGGLREALRPLRTRLETLQEQEAEMMERRFRSRLQFDPERGRKLIERAERLLRKR